MGETWYHKPGSGGQGLISSESDGRSVAVAYDVKDAPVLAAAPALLEAAKLVDDAFMLARKSCPANLRRAITMMLRPAIASASAD